MKQFEEVLDRILDKEFPQNYSDRLPQEITQAHRQDLEALLSRIEAEYATLAIPETNDYANGWNDCRKEAFKNVHTLIETERGKL